MEPERVFCEANNVLFKIMIRFEDLVILLGYVFGRSTKWNMDYGLRVSLGTMTTLLCHSEDPHNDPHEKP